MRVDLNEDILGSVDVHLQETSLVQRTVQKGKKTLYTKKKEGAPLVSHCFATLCTIFDPSIGKALPFGVWLDRILLHCVRTERNWDFSFVILRFSPMIPPADSAQKTTAMVGAACCLLFLLLHSQCLMRPATISRFVVRHPSLEEWAQNKSERPLFSHSRKRKCAKKRKKQTRSAAARPQGRK